MGIAAAPIVFEGAKRGAKWWQAKPKWVRYGTYLLPVGAVIGLVILAYWAVKKFGGKLKDWLNPFNLLPKLMENFDILPDGLKGLFQQVQGFIPGVEGTGGGVFGNWLGTLTGGSFGGVGTSSPGSLSVEDIMEVAGDDMTEEQTRDISAAERIVLWLAGQSGRSADEVRKCVQAIADKQRRSYEAAAQVLEGKFRRGEWPPPIWNVFMDCGMGI